MNSFKFIKFSAKFPYPPLKLLVECTLFRVHCEKIRWLLFLNHFNELPYFKNCFLKLAVFKAASIVVGGINVHEEIAYCYEKNLKDII